jgi:hypothetical protein
VSGGANLPSAPSIAGIQQANQNFGTATSNAAQVMNTAQGYNTNAQNNLSDVLGRTNSAANNISNVANANLNQYQNTFMPLQQSEAQQAQAYGSNANIQRLQGQAIGNVNAANQAAQQNNAAALAAEGVDPASIHGGAIQAANAVQGAAAAANAGTQAGIQGQQQAFQMANTANQLGLNVGQQGTAGAATGAGVAQAGQQNLNQTNQAGIQNLTAGNQYLQTGNQAAQTGIQGQQAQFNDQMAAYQAQQAANSSAMSGIGSLVGAAAMFMESGGPVPESVRRPDGQHGCWRSGDAEGSPPDEPDPRQHRHEARAADAGRVRHAEGCGGLRRSGSLPQDDRLDSREEKP